MTILEHGLFFLGHPVDKTKIKGAIALLKY